MLIIVYSALTIFVIQLGVSCAIDTRYNAASNASNRSEVERALRGFTSSTVTKEVLPHGIQQVLPSDVVLIERWQIKFLGKPIVVAYDKHGRVVSVIPEYE